jgi:hypothetical protein
MIVADLASCNIQYYLFGFRYTYIHYSFYDDPWENLFIHNNDEKYWIQAPEVDKNVRSIGTVNICLHYA